MHFMSDMRVIKGDVLHFIDYAFDAATMLPVQNPVYECDAFKQADGQVK
jgi:hypothetical protein